mmetsp:Transcript_28786/g.68458  ORF Transcript_28786/g.68458 Transcript_28786/m.68458 type:complete len:209 (-) Transcript_28786:343-969(-)
MLRVSTTARAHRTSAVSASRSSSTRVAIETSAAARANKRAWRSLVRACRLHTSSKASGLGLTQSTSSSSQKMGCADRSCLQRCWTKGAKLESSPRERSRRRRQARASKELWSASASGVIHASRGTARSSWPLSMARAFRRMATPPPSSSWTWSRPELPLSRSQEKNSSAPSGRGASPSLRISPFGPRSTEGSKTRSLPSDSSDNAEDD